MFYIACDSTTDMENSLHTCNCGKSPPFLVTQSPCIKFIINCHVTFWLMQMKSKIKQFKVLNYGAPIQNTSEYDQEIPQSCTAY